MLRAPAARWCPFSVSTGFVAVFLFGPVEYSEVYCGVVLEEHCVDASIDWFFLFFLLAFFFQSPFIFPPSFSNMPDVWLGVSTAPSLLFFSTKRSWWFCFPFLLSTVYCILFGSREEDFLFHCEFSSRVPSPSAFIGGNNTCGWSWVWLVVKVVRNNFIQRKRG